MHGPNETLSGGSSRTRHRRNRRDPDPPREPTAQLDLYPLSERQRRMGGTGLEPGQTEVGVRTWHFGCSGFPC